MGCASDSVPYIKTLLSLTHRYLFQTESVPPEELLCFGFFFFFKAKVFFMCISFIPKWET